MCADTDPEDCNVVLQCAQCPWRPARDVYLEHSRWQQAEKTSSNAAAYKLKKKKKCTKQYLDGAIGRTGVKAPGGPVDAGDQCRVSHVNLGHGFQRAVPHGEGVQLAGDVPRPHLAVAVAHAQQVRVELGMEESSV